MEQFLQTRTETVSVTTAALITGAGWPEPAADTLPMRTTMVSVTIMRPASAGSEAMDAVLADVDADTVAGEDTADNKRNHYTKRTGDDQGYRTVFRYCPADLCSTFEKRRRYRGHISDRVSEVCPCLFLLKATSMRRHGLSGLPSTPAKIY